MESPVLQGRQMIPNGLLDIRGVWILLLKYCASIWGHRRGVEHGLESYKAPLWGVSRNLTDAAYDHLGLK